MTTLNSQEEALLEAPDHRVDLYLSIFEPEIAMKCQVNGSYNTETQTVSYDNVIEGGYGNIKEFDFQVALIGTTEGGDEYGRTWVRSATASEIRFVVSDHIEWADDLYITILKFIEIIPVFPRIIQDPADEENVIFYKFYDVAYTNQNSILGTFVNMGCHYAGFRDPASGLASVYWTASGSYNLLGDNFTCNWSFEGATITGSTSYIPGYINYDTPGFYRTVLEVTSDSGKVDRSIRYVSIYDRPGEGTEIPITQWTLNDLSGNRDSGTYKAGIRIHDIIPRTQIRDGALVVIFADEWYGSKKQSIGGNAENRQTIKFVGYISEGSIRTNFRENYTEFSVLSPTGIMQLAECYSISTISDKNPSVWYELLNTDMKRAVYHYLEWHSTVLKCCDLEYKGTDRYRKYFESDRESLYAAIDTYVSASRMAKVVSDSQGKIWVEPEMKIIDNAAGNFPIALTIDSNDWIEEPIIDESQTAEVAWIEMGGVKYVPDTDTIFPYLCGAPGRSPRYTGRVDRIQGLALDSQEELNTIAGNVLAWENARYPGLDILLRTNYGNLDIAPQEIIKVTLLVTENNRGISFIQKPFAIRGVTWTYDAAKKSYIPRVDLHEVTQGFDAATIIIPEVPPTEVPGGGTVDIPPIQVPPIPTPSPQYISIYHNNIFVCYARALNFMDDDCE